MSTEISLSLVLSNSGESDAHDVTELMLRSLNLKSLELNTSLSLPNLLSLSLSHNVFAALQNFSNLLSIQDLNLNFNKLTSDCLRELAQCKQLQKLYLSNNCIDDSAYKVSYRSDRALRKTRARIPQQTATSTIS